MKEEIMNKLDYSYKCKDGNYNMNRPIIIPKREFNSFIFNKIVHGKWLFGFDTSEYCVDVLMNNLQKVVNRIGKGINVRCYT